MGVRVRDLEQEHRDGIRSILEHIPAGYDLESVGFNSQNDGYHVTLKSTSVYGRRLTIDSYDLPYVIRFLDRLPDTWVPPDRLRKPVL